MRRSHLGKLPGIDSGVSREKVERFKFDSFSANEELTLKRLGFLRLAVILVLAIFMLRLFFLTIVRGEENRQLSENNRIRLVAKEASRGRIYDRGGKVLADSSTVYILIKGGSSVEISGKAAHDLESQNLAGEDFEGSLGKIRVEVSRSYNFGEEFASVLGYVTRDGQDWVGKQGVEATYNNFLAGNNGEKLVEVDASGKKVSILGEKDPVRGKDIYLTIDADWQKEVFDTLSRAADKVGSRRGAAVVTDVKTGEILALVSLPSFDPSDIGKSLVSADKPLFNRAIQGNYPPGSIFKIVTSLAGLESGKITKDTEIEDVGEFSIGDIKFSNWFYTQYGGRDGILKIDRAIARSNDIFFFRVAERTGLESLRKMAIKLGFGQKTGIDLPDESFGLVPDEVWKKSTFNLPWFPGDTMHMGIGQGFVLSTPIQINDMTAYMASGKLLKPHLVSRIKAASGETKIETKVLGENLVNVANFNLVRDGMKQACQKGGTGWPFFDAPYVVGCKTGTAEKSQGNPHAWFTAFAPYDDPKIAITVLVEDGGEGSSIAGPVAREVLDWYLKKK